MTNPIPAGYHSLTPSFTFKDSKKAIEYYKKAFNAAVVDLFPAMDGKGIMHATLKLGDSLFMLGDEMHNNKSAETMGGSPLSLFVYVPDVDAAFKQAVDAGGQVILPVTEMFWGDRAACLQDPFGYQWMLATHKRDMTPEQIRKEAETFFAQAPKK
jgi:PhnB protein